MQFDKWFDSWHRKNLYQDSDGHPSCDISVAFTAGRSAGILWAEKFMVEQIIEICRKYFTDAACTGAYASQHIAEAIRKEFIGKSR